MIFRFIDEHRDQWPVRLLCDALDVSPAGYYAWRDRPASARQQRHDALLVEVRAIHAEFKARYGSPRVHAELAARGHDCCVNTVARLMQENGIAAKTARKFRCSTDSNHDLPVAENLLDRQFDPEAPNEAWVADITYLPTREGWLYLAAVEDAHPVARDPRRRGAAQVVEDRLKLGGGVADQLGREARLDAVELVVHRGERDRDLVGAGLVGGVDGRADAGDDQAHQVDHGREEQLAGVLVLGAAAEQFIQLVRDEGVLQSAPDHDTEGAVCHEALEQGSQ